MSDGVRFSWLARNIATGPVPAMKICRFCSEVHCCEGTFGTLSTTSRLGSTRLDLDFGFQFFVCRSRLAVASFKVFFEGSSLSPITDGCGDCLDKLSVAIFSGCNARGDCLDKLSVAAFSGFEAYLDYHGERRICGRPTPRFRCSRNGVSFMKGDRRGPRDDAGDTLSGSSWL
jgi:hypothetical protein